MRSTSGKNRGGGLKEAAKTHARDAASEAEELEDKLDAARLGEVSTFPEYADVLRARLGCPESAQRLQQNLLSAVKSGDVSFFNKMKSIIESLSTEHPVDWLAAKVLEAAQCLEWKNRNPASIASITELLNGEERLEVDGRPTDFLTPDERSKHVPPDGYSDKQIREVAVRVGLHKYGRRWKLDQISEEFLVRFLAESPNWTEKQWRENYEIMRPYLERIERLKKKGH